MEDANNMNGHLPKHLLRKFSGIWASTADKNFELKFKKKKKKVERHLPLCDCVIGMPDFNGYLDKWKFTKVSHVRLTLNSFLT